MTSPLVGVWELVSNTDKAISIATDTHFGMVLERPTVRRGMAGTYTIQGHRARYDIVVDTAMKAAPQLDVEFQRDGETLTSRLISGGTVSPAGHTDVWRQVSDLHMTSPFAGVWQLISETDQSINVRTDTYWVTIAERGDVRRGFAGTFTVQGDRLDHAILVDTALNAPSQIAFEGQVEGETLIAKRLVGSLSLPAGYVDRWWKIG